MKYKIKPAPPNEQGLRWCSGECPWFNAFSGECGMDGNFAEYEDQVCPVWAAECVALLLAPGATAERLDAFEKWERCRDALLGSGDVEVER